MFFILDFLLLPLFFVGIVVSPLLLYLVGKILKVQHPQFTYGSCMKISLIVSVVFLFFTLFCLKVFPLTSLYLFIPLLFAIVSFCFLVKDFFKVSIKKLLLIMVLYFVLIGCVFGFSVNLFMYLVTSNAYNHQIM